MLRMFGSGRVRTHANDTNRTDTRKPVARPVEAANFSTHITARKAMK